MHTARVVTCPGSLCLSLDTNLVYLFTFVCFCVSRYTVAFIWPISLNIWHLYVYYKAWARHKGWWPSWCCCQKKPSDNMPQMGDSTTLPSASRYVSMLLTSESEPPIRHVSTASSRAHECPPIHGLNTSYFEKETTWPTVMIRCVPLTTESQNGCASFLDFSSIMCRHTV
jgi:hypothetical protein